jgi:hypothetical protein
MLVWTLVVWVITPCRSFRINQSFGETCDLLCYISNARVRVALRLVDSQQVCLGVESHVGLMTNATERQRDDYPFTIHAAVVSNLN